MRVLHLAPAHAAFDTRVFVKECRTLADAGYRVSLAAPHDRAEVVDGVRIIPIPRWSSRRGRFLGNLWHCLRIVARERADIYHFHDPEVFLVGAALAFAGRRVVYDSHEDFPRLVLDRPWIPPRLRAPLAASVRLAERTAVPLFAGTISAEVEGAKRFRRGRIVIVQNYVRADEFVDLAKVDAVDRENRLVYVGNLTEQRGAAQMVEALARTRTDVRLTLAGSFVPKDLEQRMRDVPGWDQVDYVGWLDREGIVDVLTQARIGVVLLQPTRKYTEGAIPVKLFEYLAAGLAVVVSDFPALREIVAPAQVGALVDPRDVDAIAAAIDELLADPDELAAIARRGPAVVREQYSWESEAGKLLALYEQIGPEPAGPRRG